MYIAKGDQHTFIILMNGKWATFTTDSFRLKRRVTHSMQDYILNVKKLDMIDIYIIVNRYEYLLI